MATRSRKTAMVLGLIVLCALGLLGTCALDLGADRQPVDGPGGGDAAGSDVADGWNSEPGNGQRRRRRTAQPTEAAGDAAVDAGSDSDGTQVTDTEGVSNARAVPPEELDRTLVRVTGADGKPLAGARVELRPPRGLDQPRDWAASLAGMARTQEPTATAHTDADGNVRMPELAEGFWEIRIGADGQAGAVLPVTARADLMIRVRLEPSHDVAGQVLGVDGQPREGLIVLLTGLDAELRPGGRPVVSARARTDADGRFRHHAVAAREYDVWVTWPDAMPIRVGHVRVPQSAPFTLRLLGGGVVTGVVTDDVSGDPIDGVRVLALGTDGYVGVAWTDAEGAYSIDALGRGPIRRLEAWSHGFPTLAHADAPFEIALGEPVQRDFALYRGGTIVGVVRGPDGPVEGARVLVWVADDKRFITHRFGKTDAGGRYRVEGVRPGLALVEVHSTGLVHPGIPAEMQRWAELLGKTLDDRCKAQVLENEEAWLDVTLEPDG